MIETVYTTSSFRWLHDLTHGRRVTPPENMVPLTNDEGEAVLDQTGETVLVPPDDWQPTFEEVELDTVVVMSMDPNGQPDGTIFKFAFSKEVLALFLSTYVGFLDADGRIELRKAIDESSGITLPEISLNREQRRHLRLAE